MASVFVLPDPIDLPAHFFRTFHLDNFSIFKVLRGLTYNVIFFGFFRLSNLSFRSRLLNWLFNRFFNRFFYMFFCWFFGPFLGSALSRPCPAFSSGGFSRLFSRLFQPAFQQVLQQQVLFRP